MIGYILLLVTTGFALIVTGIVTMIEVVIVGVRLESGRYHYLRDFIFVRDVYILAGVVLATVILCVWVLNSELPEQVPPPPPPTPTPTPTPIPTPTVEPIPLRITELVHLKNQPAIFKLHFSATFRCTGRYILVLEDGTQSRPTICRDRVHSTLEFIFSTLPPVGTGVVRMDKDRDGRIVGLNGLELTSYALPQTVVVR